MSKSECPTPPGKLEETIQTDLLSTIELILILITKNS